MFSKESVKKYLKEKVTRDVLKDSPTDLRIMTSNVLFGGMSDLPKGLTDEDRAIILTEYYKHYKPDFLGLQEMEPKINALVTEGLRDEYLIPDTDYQGACIFTPVLYRVDKWTPLETGFHRFPRHWCWQYHWGLYESKSDPDVRVIHANFHYHPSALPYVDSRCHAVVELNGELLRLREKYPDVPIFLSGDYNVSANSPEYAGTFSQGLKMRSGMLLTDDNDGYMWSVHPVGYPPNFEYEAIDHISVTEETVRVKRHRLINDEMIIYGSDHCPMFIDVELNLSPKAEML